MSSSRNGDLKKRKTEVLNNSFRKDAEIKYSCGEYKTALQLFTKALKHAPTDVASLVHRSKCYKKLRNLRKAIDDVDIALHLHNLNKEALLQKANLLYHSSNLELALVYYNRGHKHYPKNKDFILGIEKTEMAINKGRKSRAKPMKLTEAGDLTFLVHKVPPPKQFSWQKPKPKSPQHAPSATFNTRPLCQLIRIHKTPTVSLPRGPSFPTIALTETDSSVLNYDDKRPESRTVKMTMGKLYNDKKYLQELIENGRFPAILGSSGSPVGEIAEDGVSFLLDRAAYWDRLGPLPPPPAPRKFRSRFSGSTMSLDSLGSYRSQDSKTTWKSTDTLRTSKTGKSVKSRYALNRKRKQSTPKPDPSKIVFKFPSAGLLTELNQRMMTEIIEEDESAKLDRQETVYDQKESIDTAGKSVSDYIKKEMHGIDEDFKSNKFRDVQERCEACLQLLDRYSQEQVPDKFEMTANLQSYLGNAAMQAGKLDLALKYHQMDLLIGDQLENETIRYRALGNTGRVFMMKGKHNKALEMFTMKAPLCKTAKETASLFHEIGNCFLMLNNFHSAREAGTKSLIAAEEADNAHQQLQACVLNGLADVNMKRFESAYQSFEAALDHAKSIGDERAEMAMKKALVDINKKLASKLKKENTQRETRAVTSSTVSTARTSVMVET